MKCGYIEYQNNIGADKKLKSTNHCKTKRASTVNKIQFSNPNNEIREENVFLCLFKRYEEGL